MLINPVRLQLPPLRFESFHLPPPVVEGLQHIDSNALTLICARMGYGKTISLSLMLPQLPLGCCVLRLDKSLAGPQTFLAYLIAALRHGGLLSEERANSLTDQSTHVQWGSEEAAKFLDSAIASLQQAAPFVLVLEDYHYLDPQGVSPNATIQIGAMIDYLLKWRPDNMHMVITARHLPGFRQYHDLDAQRQCLLLTSSHYIYQASDITRLARQAFDLRLSESEAATVFDISHGWLFLIGLILNETKNRQGQGCLRIVHEIRDTLSDTGDNTPGGPRVYLQRDISAIQGRLVHYFVDSLLDQFDRSFQAQLLESSILPWLDERLCSLLPAIPDAQAFLNSLQKLDLWVETRDRFSLQYHYLLLEILRQHLREQEGGVEIGNLVRSVASAMASTPRAPADWKEAIRLLMRFGEVEAATKMLCQYGDMLLDFSEYEFVDLLAMRLRNDRCNRLWDLPDLTLLNGKARRRLDRDTARRILSYVATDPRNPDSAADANIELAVLDLSEGRVNDAQQRLVELLDDIGSQPAHWEVQYLRSKALAKLGHVYLMQGQVKLATDAETQAIEGILDRASLLGLEPHLVESHRTRGAAYLWQANISSAESDLFRAQHYADSRALRRNIAYTTHLQAYLALAKGKAEEARLLVRHALAGISAVDHSSRAALLTALGEIEMAGMNYHAARAAYSAVTEGNLIWKYRAVLGRAILDAMTASPEATIQIPPLSIHEPESISNDYWRAEQRVVLGVYEMRTGSVASAIQKLVDAESQFRAGGAKLRQLGCLSHVLLAQHQSGQCIESQLDSYLRELASLRVLWFPYWHEDTVASLLCLSLNRRIQRDFIVDFAPQVLSREQEARFLALVKRASKSEADVVEAARHILSSLHEQSTGAVDVVARHFRLRSESILEIERLMGKGWITDSDLLVATRFDIDARHLLVLLYYINAHRREDPSVSIRDWIASHLALSRSTVRNYIDDIRAALRLPTDTKGESVHYWWQQNVLQAGTPSDPTFQ